jgi:hypothetical protein
MHSALVVALGSPILIGVYDASGKLIEAIKSDEVASDALAKIFEGLLAKYSLSHLIYANGPGSFMGIKVAYLFLKTLSIVKNIPLLAEDGFFFNENCPIKAYGKLYFVKNSAMITLEPLISPKAKAFALPHNIVLDNFKTENLPYYGMDAVG